MDFFVFAKANAKTQHSRTQTTNYTTVIANQIIYSLPVMKCMNNCKLSEERVEEMEEIDKSQTKTSSIRH